MRYLRCVASSAIFVLACSSADAARLATTTSGSIASFYLKGDALDNNFDTVDFLLTLHGGTFLNASSGLNAGIPRPAGDPFTYINRELNADPLDGGLGWSIVGLTNTANQLSFSGGPPEGKIDTGDDNGPGLFLANATVSAAAVSITCESRVRLISEGTIVADLPFHLGGCVPEPSSLFLAGTGLCGFLAAATARVKHPANSRNPK